MTILMRTKLPTTRTSSTHKFTIHSTNVGHVCVDCGSVQQIDGDLDVYLTVSIYENGQPGELFVKLNRHGDTIKGLVDQWAIVVSIALQHGVPLELICKKGMYSSFEPAGMTDTYLYDSAGKITGKINARSIIDYICRWLHTTYIKSS